MEVKRKLKLNSTHQLLSYSMAANVPGFEGEKIFKCREGDSEEDIENLVKSFVAKLNSISKKSFDILIEEYRHIIKALDQAIADEAAYFPDMGKKPTNQKLNLIVKYLGKMKKK